MTEAQRTYVAEQLDAMPLGSYVGIHMVKGGWTKGHVDTWTSNHDDIGSAADVVAASSGHLIKWPEGQSVPNGPAPVGIAAPAWATAVDDWTWIDDDESFWQREVTCAFRSNGDGDGVDVDAFQEVDSAGVVTVSKPAALTDDMREMSDPADLLEYGQMIVRAAEMMAGLDGAPAQLAA